MRAYFDRTRPTIIWTPVHGEYICFYSIFWDDERRNSEAPSAPGLIGQAALRPNRYAARVWAATPTGDQGAAE